MFHNLITTKARDRDVINSIATSPDVGSIVAAAVDVETGASSMQHYIDTSDRKRIPYSKFKSTFGNPATNIRTMEFPYKTIYAKGTRDAFKINNLRCHSKIAGNLMAAMILVGCFYTEEERDTLNLDAFIGCYVNRSKRGSSQLSAHAWGVAVDWDPLHNDLKTKWKDAGFSDPSKLKFVYAYYLCGFVNKGLADNYDPMHFEYAAKPDPRVIPLLDQLKAGLGLEYRN